MNEKIETGIREAIREALDSQLHAIRFNLSNVLGGFLYSLKLELEKEGGVGDIEKLVNQIVNTSHYTGPEGEEWPTWETKGTEEIYKRLEKALQSHGIEQAWNFGKNKKETPNVQ